MCASINYCCSTTEFRRASRGHFLRSFRQEEGAESAKSRRRGRTRHSRGSSHRLGTTDNDQRPAVSTNGAGVAVSAADVGWDTALRRWSAERPPNGPMNDGARARAGAGSREPKIGYQPAQSGRTTPKIERVRAFSRRDVHHWILGVTSPLGGRRHNFRNPKI